MKKKIFRWLLPVALAGLGAYYAPVPIADFFSAACFALAGLLALTFLLPLLHKRNPKLAISIAMLLALAVFLVLCLMLGTGSQIADAQSGAPETNVPYIVVLGAKVNGDTPSEHLQCRIAAAYAYLTAHPECVAILSGGQGSDEVMTEAQCMFRALSELGIAPERLWLEEKATSTWENITFSLDVIQEKTGLRPETIGLVTSEFHLYRAGLFAADCGAQIVGIPGETADEVEYIYYFLREIAGVWHYYLLGGQYHD